MNLKISNSPASPSVVESNGSTETFYEDLMDWAKSRKQQFLRKRAKGAPVIPSEETKPVVDAETETWVASWYTPPTLSNKRVQQSITASPSPEKPTSAGDRPQQKTVQPIATETQVDSVAQSPVSETSASTHPESSTVPFVRGQQVQLRLDGSSLPEGVPEDAVLTVQEVYINPYQNYPGAQCVWCMSEAFPGLKSIAADRLIPAATDTSATPMPSDLLTPSTGEEPSGSPIAYWLVEDSQNLEVALEPFHTAPVIAVDLETTGLDPFKDKIRLVQLAIADHPVVLIDFFKIPPAERSSLKSLLQGKAIKVLQNGKFDLKFLCQAGLPVTGNLFDTMLAAQLLAAGVRSHGYNLAELVKVYLGETLSKEQRRSDWSSPTLSTEQLEYAARDAAILLRLRDVMRQKLITTQLVETAKLEFAGLAAIVSMELNGMLLDLSRWDSLRQDLEKRRDALAEVLRQQLQPALVHTQLDILGNQVAINLDSQPQVLEALQQLGVPLKDTNKLSLIPLAEAHPPVRALLDYRKAAKAVQAFATSLPKHIHPITGRIHPDYQQLGAATGRMSCRDPNLQQIPRDKIFRSCFVPAPGYRLIVADYSQIELRVAAELSGDRRMIEAYQNDEDLHQLTAALIAEKSIEEVDKSERQAAKAVNFGLIYAMGAYGLAEYAYNNYGVRMSLDQATTFRKRYFDAYQGIARWHREIKKRMPSSMRTLGDRLRLWRDEPKLTELLNTPVQGTSADITKAALAKLPFALEGTGAKLIGTVHDEILLEAPEETAEEAACVLQIVMEQAGQHYLTKVPVKADVSVVGSWAEK